MIAEREEHFPAVALQSRHLLPRARMDPIPVVFVALREIVWFEEPDVLDGGGVPIDEHVIHDLQHRKVHRP
jgi:hypothetical protein